MKLYKLLALLFAFTSIIQAEESPHQFAGKHFLGSYLDCDVEAISDVDGLLQAMNQAVEASGATILNMTPHVFPPDGLTVVYLLSESHASIHTYPEYRACFVDLFTCGDHCSEEQFDQILRAYLKPKQVNAKLFARHETVEDITHLR